MAAFCYGSSQLSGEVQDERGQLVIFREEVIELLIGTENTPEVSSVYYVHQYINSTLKSLGQ